MSAVTIIMPSYNVSEYIRQCMDSVRTQSLKDIEIISVDAGSTDGTEEILREYALKDKRIRLLHSEKKSYGYQMNLAIREAKGDYIGIVETDDYVETSMYEILFKTAIRHDADIVKTQRYDVYEFNGGKKLEIVSTNLPQDKKTNVVLNPDEDPSLHRYDTYIWNAIYRSDFLKKGDLRFRETPGAAFQDIGFFNMSMNAAQKVVYLRNPLYHYRKIRPGSSTWKSDCVHYVCEEYRNVIESGCIQPGHIESVYTVLIPAFFTEFDKVIAAGLESYSKYNPDLDWFETTMRDALKKEILKIDTLEERWKNKLLVFLLDRKLYIREQQRGMLNIRNWKNDFINRLRNKCLLIFGAGNYGMTMFHFLIRNGVKPDAFIDNNPALRNVSHYGVPLFSIDEAALKYCDGYFLICSRNGSEEMKRQLLDYGIDEKQMEIFDGNDRDMIRAWKTLPILEMAV